MADIVVTSDLWRNRVYPEGLIENWLVSNESDVAIGQSVAMVRIEGELITLKAPASGKLSIHIPENGPVDPGMVIAKILE